VGASDDPSRLTGRPIAYMQRLGFDGTILPVNPGRTMVQGLKCFESLSSIPQKVDLALIATPAAKVEAAVLEGIAAGIRSFVVFSSGFAEFDEEGAERQRRLAAIATEHGAGILGPNCLGVVNSSTGLVASFNTAMEINPLRAGSFGFVSQSGALGSYWLDAAIRSGIGFSHWITTGNECDVEVGAAIEFLAGDADTRIIGLYAEHVRDVNALRRGLLHAAAAGKPVLVIKSGSSPMGAAAAASHTGALAGDDGLYDACFAQCGALRVQSITEMLDVAQLYAWEAVPQSNRLGVMTVSGGAGVMIADAAEKAGLVIPSFQPATQDQLAKVLPGFAKPNNPIDLTAAVITDRELLAHTLAALCSDSTLGLRVLFIGLLQSIAPQVTEAILAERAASGKPVVVVWFGADPAVVAKLESARIPVFTDIPQAVRAIALAWKAQVLRARAERSSTQFAPLRHPRPRVDISEAAAKRMIGEWDGIRVPSGVLIAGKAADEGCLQHLEPPLVAKLQSAQLKHKSEHGGVVLKIASRVHAAEVAEALTAKAHREGLPIDGVLVEQMVPFDFELVCGLRHDPAFGPVLVLGRGGVGVEADPDIVSLLLPITQEDVREALLGLRFATLLKGYRGGPAIDFGRCAHAIVRLSEQFLAQPRLLELEINPLAVRGGECWALDALATLESTEAAS
jgi:acetate---CoA ligase (ADP-forming)